MMFTIVFSRKKLYNIIILTETTKHFLWIKGKITDEEILYHSNLYSDSRYGRVRY